MPPEHSRQRAVKSVSDSKLCRLRFVSQQFPRPATRIIEWRIGYNIERPHGFLGNLTVPRVSRCRATAGAIATSLDSASDISGRGQSFVTATQSTSTSKGPVHSGTQKKMRAGGFFGK